MTGPYRLEEDGPACVLTHANIPRERFELRILGPGSLAEEIALTRIVALLNAYDGTPGNALADAVTAREGEFPGVFRPTRV